MARPPVIVALDATDMDRVRAMIRATASHVWGFKIGLEFFVRHGADGIAQTGVDPGQLFLDLKFHDIPNTVAGAVRSAAAIGPAMMTVHAAGGPAMLAAARAARDAAADASGKRPKLLAVTVLTSFDDADLEAVGQTAPVAKQARRLATLAQDNGFDGAICSPREIAVLRAECGPDFALVVPGIRPAGADIADQKRIMTPAEAIGAGADYLVVGRPITASADPAAAAIRIAESLADIRAVAS